ncbi:MAG TPA: glyoxalase superfamily protein, partial [Candidatus Eremiobacteraceae bacterium]|nr:glyoxalase superfamily protein [Candidatus Eremiobacteraceae bacterium]
KAREFYIDYLGFKIEFEARFSDNAPLFMGISRDGLVLYLSEHHGDGVPGIHVVVDMVGVDALHEELKARRYRYMNPSIQDQEWGTRELCVIDPSGNKIYFSERKQS